MSKEIQIIKGVKIFDDMRDLDEKMDMYQRSLVLVVKEIGYREPYYLLRDELHRLDDLKRQMNVAQYDTVKSVDELIGVGKPVSAAHIHSTIHKLCEELTHLMNLRAEIHNKQGPDTKAYKVVEEEVNRVHNEIEVEKRKKYVIVNGGEHL